MKESQYFDPYDGTCIYYDDAAASKTTDAAASTTGMQLASMGIECYEWDTSVCDMNGMRCARVELEDWNSKFTDTDSFQQLHKEMSKDSRQREDDAR